MTPWSRRLRRLWASSAMRLHAGTAWKRHPSVKIATTGLIGLYMALSLRRVYACSWPVALLLPFLLNTMLLVANVAVYRTLQFLVTFALT